MSECVCKCEVVDSQIFGGGRSARFAVPESRCEGTGRTVPRGYSTVRRHCLGGAGGDNVVVAGTCGTGRKTSLERQGTPRVGFTSWASPFAQVCVLSSHTFQTANINKEFWQSDRRHDRLCQGSERTGTRVNSDPADDCRNRFSPDCFYSA